MIMWAESAAASEGAAWAYALLAVAHGGLVLPAVLAPCQVFTYIACKRKMQGERQSFWKRRHVKVHALDVDQGTISPKIPAQPLSAWILALLQNPAHGS